MIPARENVPQDGKKGTEKQQLSGDFYDFIPGGDGRLLARSLRADPTLPAVPAVAAPRDVRSAKAGAEGKLFGSVTSTDIAEETAH